MITKEQYEEYKEEAKLIKSENKELGKKYSEHLRELMKIEKELEFNNRRLITVEAFVFNYENQKEVELESLRKYFSIGQKPLQGIVKIKTEEGGDG